MKNAIFSEIRLLILCGILGWTAGMVPAACYAQEGQAQSVRVDAYHFRGSAAGAYPGATYEIVTAHRVLDRDNNNYYLDPSGETRLRTLELISAGAMRPGNLALMGKITGTAGSGYYINLNSNPGGAPMVYIHSLQTSSRITWDDPYSFSPFPIDDTAIGGKHVYDVAEGIQARGCAVGDVVIISEDEDLSVTKSRRRFDPRVAGVISGDPKLFMGIEEGKTPLALVGVVKCKVSAENGAIKPGDLLVTSSVPGHAMAAAAKQILPGMLVGKALQPLEKGTGEILVMVNKQ